MSLSGDSRTSTPTLRRVGAALSHNLRQFPLYMSKKSLSGTLSNPVRPIIRNRNNRTAYPRFLQGCAVGSALGGVLFVAWGYIDRPNIPENLRIATQVLACTVPTLFVVGVAGVLVLCGGRVGVLGWVGMVLALYGSGLTALANIFDVEPLLYDYFIMRGWPRSLIEGLAVMNTGLVLVGMATVRTRTLRGLGVLALAIGAFGWGYDLSDSAGVALEAAPRSVHAGFGLLFSLGWVGLGLTIWLAAMKQP
jgi:hypothetical protein